MNAKESYGPGAVLGCGRTDGGPGMEPAIQVQKLTKQVP